MNIYKPEKFTQNDIIVLDFRISSDAGRKKVHIIKPSTNRTGYTMNLDKFFNEVIQGEKIFYKRGKFYRTYIPFKNVWNKQNELNIEVLTDKIGSVFHLCPQFVWRVFWYKDDDDKTFYYLANGDNNLEIGYDVPEFCKNYELKTDLIKNELVVKGYPNILIDEGLTNLDILVWHIETCDIKEIWINKIS